MKNLLVVVVCVLVLTLFAHRSEYTSQQPQPKTKKISTIMVKRIILFIVSVLAAVAALTPSERAAAMLGKMNLTEKIIMMHGAVSDIYVGNIPGNDRLGIPMIKMQDGPQGFR